VSKHTRVRGRFLLRGTRQTQEVQRVVESGSGAVQQDRGGGEVEKKRLLPPRLLIPNRILAGAVKKSEDGSSCTPRVPSCEQGVPWIRAIPFSGPGKTQTIVDTRKKNLARKEPGKEKR